VSWRQRSDVLPPQQRYRRISLSVGAVAAIGLAMAQDGAGVGAVAAVARTDSEVPSVAQTEVLPGSAVLTRLGATSATSGTGTVSVELGTPPAGATNIQIAVSCLTAGTFSLPGGGSMTCVPADVATSRPTIFTPPLEVGQDSITLHAGAGEQWSLSTTYASVRLTPWESNEAGLTYGVANSHGEPDLIAVIASNGQTGYADHTLLTPVAAANPTQALEFQNSPLVTEHVPVYLSDGHTRIGSYDIQIHQAYLDAGTPLSRVTPINSPPDPPPVEVEAGN
jgi:hypothetical protein